MSAAPFLVLEGLIKRFATITVLDRLDLEVGEGEVLALLGLSGSGKTTALRLVAGFETPDSGRIVVSGEDVTRLAPARRGFGMVFQHYALFPHMTVGGNIAFGLESQAWPRERRAERVEEMLRLVDLEGYADRRIDAVSGGQQQRVALARALAPEPRLLLLDEPLSNLDPALRARTRRELKRAVGSLGITTLLVTHEQEEAFDVGDRVAVLDRGRLAQVGTPQSLYERPATRFVATFVGRASTLKGRIAERRSDGYRVALGTGCRMIAQAAAVHPGDGRSAEPELEVGAAVDLVARPESLRLAAPEAPGALLGKVLEERFTGPLRYAVVEVEGQSPVEVLVAHSVAIGEAVGVLQTEGALIPTLFPGVPA